MCTIFYYVTSLRYCRGAAHATSRRVALHPSASGTLLLYKQRRSSVLPLGATRATSKHGQPTCLHRRVYGEVNDDTWRRAALVDRHGDRQHWWTSHGTGLCTVFVLARQYSARYLAPCKTVALDIASHPTSRAALRDCTPTVLAFY